MSGTILTVGKDGTGRRLAIISRGGHPQMNSTEGCEVLMVEVVTGWSRRKITDWYDAQLVARPWEIRQ